MNDSKRKSSRFLSNLIHYLSGVIIGFTICSQLTTFRNQWKDSPFCPIDSNDLLNSDQFIDKNAVLGQLIDKIRNQNSGNNLLLIGVMTAQKYLDSRALSIYKTWAQSLEGKVIFFSSSSSRSSYGLPLVSLPTVDDSYPPQKKSFLMFKFMSDHFIDRFEYFMRADDDVYINVDKLHEFLRSVNSSKPQFIGQAGLGNKEEFGQLNLQSDQNFCMGGPGVVMSRATLQLFTRNIQYCLKHLYSTHEDVEIGRCVRLSAGIPCTWSYEMQHLFHHNSSLENSIKNGIIGSKYIDKALTIHPIKSPSNMRRLHHYFKNREHQTVRHELNVLYRNLFEMSRLLNQSIDPIINQLDDKYSKFDCLGQTIDFSSLSKRDASIAWDFISHNIYSATNINPKRHIESHIIRSIDNNINEIMTLINRGSKQKGRTMEFKGLYYGYTRLDPLIANQFILDLLLVYKRFRGRKVSIPVRRHTYAVQTFSNSQIRVIEEYMVSKVVNIIVPLSGRIETFLRFVDNFKEVQSNDKYISLAVVLFPDAAKSADEFNRLRTILEDIQKSGIPLRLALLGGFFSRAAALQRGSSMFESDALLLFLDVDMQFTHEVITRVRLNTIQRKQLYFPIVFSEYSSRFLSDNSSTNQLNEERGYWRQFGFGIVSLFNNDLQSVGGFNVSIQGWGMEDVNLYDRIIRSNLTIFRAIDPNLVHVYHDIHCDHSLTSLQYEMCLGTMLTSLGSVQQLAKHIIANQLL